MTNHHVSTNWEKVLCPSKQLQVRKLMLCTLHMYLCTTVDRATAWILFRLALHSGHVLGALVGDRSQGVRELALCPGGLCSNSPLPTKLKSEPVTVLPTEDPGSQSFVRDSLPRERGKTALNCYTVASPGWKRCDGRVGMSPASWRRMEEGMVIGCWRWGGWRWNTIKASMGVWVDTPQYPWMESRQPARGEVGCWVFVAETGVMYASVSSYAPALHSGQGPVWNRLWENSPSAHMHFVMG